MMKIVLLNAATLPFYREELASLLTESISLDEQPGFSENLTQQQAEDFFHDLRPAMHHNQLFLWIARDEKGLVGSVQLDLRGCTAQSRLARICRLLVIPAARRQGVGKQLIHAVEKTATALGIENLGIDIMAGTHAELFCRTQGYRCIRVTPASQYSQHQYAVYGKQLHLLCASLNHCA
jgi:acetyltransferase